MRIRSSMVWVGVVAAMVACSPTDTNNSDASPAADCGIQIDRFKEIEIVDDAVVTDARAKNATAGPWSFRYAIEQLTDGDPSDFVGKWLQSWGSTMQVNSFPVPTRPNGYSTLVCPWLRATPENGCDETCNTCAAKRFDLAKAPFKLLAIANRMDLSLIYEGTAGEGRFVFGATSGPGDDAEFRACASIADTGCTLDMSVIFEYELPTSEGRDLAYWATQYHQLGTFAAFDEPYRVAVQKITDSFSRAGVAPSKPNGSGLRQLRTNERIFEWDWELREFTLTPGALMLAATENTPDASLNGSESLKTWLVGNRDIVKTERHQVPRTLLGGRAPSQTFKWYVEVDEPLRHAFARNTCNGCHQTEETPVDGNFHISPHRSGRAKLSPFMNNPADPEHDELGTRSRHIASILCEAGAAAPAAP